METLWSMLFLDILCFKLPAKTNLCFHSQQYLLKFFHWQKMFDNSIFCYSCFLYLNLTFTPRSVTNTSFESFYFECLSSSTLFKFFELTGFSKISFTRRVMRHRGWHRMFPYTSSFSKKIVLRWKALLPISFSKYNNQSQTNLVLTNKRELYMLQVPNKQQYDWTWS